MLDRGYCRIACQTFRGRGTTSYRLDIALPYFGIDRGPCLPCTAAHHFTTEVLSAVTGKMTRYFVPDPSDTDDRWRLLRGSKYEVLVFCPPGT